MREPPPQTSPYPQAPQEPAAGPPMAPPEAQAPEAGEAEPGAAEPTEETPAVELEETSEDIWQGEEPAPEQPVAPEGAAPEDEAGQKAAEEPAGPEDGTAAEENEEPAEEKTAGDTRQELKDYLAKVKDKLEKDRRDAERAKAPEKLKAPGLLDYLGKLADHLPNGVKSRFQESDERLRMEVLKSKLFGRRGLRKKATTREPAGAPAAPVGLTRKKITDTFGYMKGLATFIRDGGMRKNMMGKLDKLLGKLRGR